MSVHYDENRATVTVSKRTLAEFVEKTTAAGITTVEIGLSGRFHSECHREAMAPLSRFCDANQAFRLPSASRLLLSCRKDAAGTEGQHIITGNLSDVALAAMLVEPSQWWQTFRSFCSVNRGAVTIVTLGSERCTPPTLVQSLPPGCQLIHFADVALPQDTPLSSPTPPPGSENDIAVIGMACRVAGADDLDEFWEVVRHGKSQHTEVPKSRFGFDTSFRALDPQKKWYGNFIQNHDAWDHKFFKKTPREGASMDPQQRLLLQVAYQAVEQSGYFQSQSSSTDVGCYIGTCAVDYENNIACQEPNAFSSTGTLRGFIAGRISHYFGWTGPGLTIDTACSSAAVAVHQACRAILSGECHTALAGGVNMMTQPLAYQNLAAASFLSQTGQCKPFCTHADGYCRGEGIAAVFLKKRSAAIADGDQILGVIAGTAVQQNQNCTPIFVPNSPSLATLFDKVLSQAHLNAQQVSYVEAHGTGTGVGDPAEYESISQVFAPVKRAKALQLGSVKGLVGHTESTSGLVSLVKVLLMMHENTIPPQASFRQINPHIKANESVEISTTLNPWDDTFKAALINNYGASGSNASIVVTQSPLYHSGAAMQTPVKTGVKFPFWLTAFDDKSLRAYAHKLNMYLEARSIDRIETVSFNVFRQSNRKLNRAVLFSCSTVQELQQKLSAPDLQTIETPQPRPVVLCFGGQVSTFVGLDRAIVDNTTIFRSHLNHCDAICTDLGLGSIYPDIFQRSPINDTVKLQLCLFSLQYACAKSWIDCGIKPVGLVGHSFGELTALCIAEVLDLQDTVKMVAGRARIVRDDWGPEKGAMMAVEAEIELVKKLVASTAAGPHPVTIACYNGPRSFTLAGTTEAIEQVAKTIATDVASGLIRVKKLKVTNAFHSALVEDLRPMLEHMAQDLTFRAPVIPIEFAREVNLKGPLSPRFVADHMRDPVYFHQAVQRLSAKHPSCVWLEAGSNSTVTNMASRVFTVGGHSSPASPSPQLFLGVNITTDESTTNLTSTTLNLWKSGINTHFWQHHPSQTSHHPLMLLPPYQFEMSRHWIELKAPLRAPAPMSSKSQATQGLWSFEGYQDTKQTSARFRINTDSSQYNDMVGSHMIAQTAPICPATLEVDMAIDALMSLHEQFKEGHLQPQILDVENHAPVCLDSSRNLWLDLIATDVSCSPCRQWSWKFVSDKAEKASSSTVHVSGQILFCPVQDPRLQAEFSRYERLVNHARCLDVLGGNEAGDDIIQGKNIYKAFDEVVHYGERYQGLQRLVGRQASSESAGRVLKKYAGDTWLDAHLSDCFSQVGGIWVNCMTDKSPSDMYIANGFEKWIRSPKLRKGDSRPDEWHVLACHEKRDTNFITDIFVFDPSNGALVEVILGINYARVSKNSMSKLLQRLTLDDSMGQMMDKTGYESPKTRGHTPMANQDATHAGHSNGHNIGATLVVEAQEHKQPNGLQASVTPRIRLILCELSGLEPDDVNDNAELADLGIDSLMGMELAREIEIAFGCALPTEVLLEVRDFPGLVHCVQQVLGLDDSADESHDMASENSTATSSDDAVPMSSTKTSAPQSPSEPTFLTNGNQKRNSSAHHVYDTNGLKNDSNTLELPSSMVLEAFAECKLLTDHFIEDHGCSHYLETVMPLQTQLCIALTIEAFQKLGCDLRAAKPGQTLERISHVPMLSRLVNYLYKMLEEEAGIIAQDDGRTTRTGVPISEASSFELLQYLLREFPEHQYPHKLTHFAGSRLAEVLSGESDGVKVIFGSQEGRELASGLYADSPLNRLSYTQMRDFVTKLVARLPAGSGPLKILELGAGTGGTTKWIAPLLLDLGIPVEYTFSDLAPSFVAAARKTLGKEYQFMKFRTVDFETTPPEDLVGSQHMVLASNAVHATHSLTRSLDNIRKTLRQDGFVMILEMTRTLYWVDMIFGLLEGWWLFDDGREHAIANESRWEKDLYSVGFGHVDWTDGKRPEVTIQRVLLALQGNGSNSKANSAETAARQAMIDAYVDKYTAGFTGPVHAPTRAAPRDGLCVLVTGGTGSLGSHIVAWLLQQAQVKTVVCLNRRGAMDAVARQLQALESRGIRSAEVSKLKVFETDATKPQLGLDKEKYNMLAATVTHMIHNAWPMSGTRALKGFEAQFKTMRNLLDLSSAAASTQSAPIGFQFVSSIAAVGHQPLVTGSALVAEDRMDTAAAVLPNGYGEAKWACERMIDETLHKHPLHFRAMAVRLGQVAGSRTSGFWNDTEHLTLMMQSSQTLGVFPALEGTLSWTPVNDVAGALSELLLQHDSAPWPIYHIDNPVRQEWSETAALLADGVGAEVVDFAEWVRLVRSYPGAVEGENPAAKLVDFFEKDFQRMSCGGLLLDTSRACEHSETLRAVGPVGPDVVRRYIDAWKTAGILKY